MFHKLCRIAPTCTLPVNKINKNLMQSINNTVTSSALQFSGVSVAPVKSVRDLGIHIDADVYADARTADGITVLWCSASDPPICSDGHSTDAGCQAGTVSA